MGWEEGPAGSTAASANPARKLIIERELEGYGIRMNTHPPNISIKQKVGPFLQSNFFLHHAGLCGIDADDRLHTPVQLFVRKKKRSEEIAPRLPAFFLLFCQRDHRLDSAHAFLPCLMRSIPESPRPHLSCHLVPGQGTPHPLPPRLQERGGVAMSTTCKLTHLDQETVAEVLKEYRMARAARTPEGTPLPPVGGVRVEWEAPQT